MGNENGPEYIEIVHMDKSVLAEYEKRGPVQKAIVERIRALSEVHYFTNYYLDENFPDVPKDTRIRLGGVSWEWCAETRKNELERAGYTNVVVDREISFSSEDRYADAGLVGS